MIHFARCRSHAEALRCAHRSRTSVIIPPHMPRSARDRRSRGRPVLLAAAVAMFVANKPRMDAVALIMLTILPFTGVISMGEALAGFSDSNIVLIAALFVVGEGLVRTGVVQKLADWLIARASSSETRLIVLLMLSVALLGSVMSSTGVVAIFIPVALRIARNTGTAPSRLMMPLSAAALISGMLTLVGTAPNLVVNSELMRSGATGFHFFSFTPFGVPVLALGIAYMLVARLWLAARAESAAAVVRRPSLRDWIQQYDLTNREHRLRVTRASPLVGKTVEEVDLRHTYGVSIVAIERRRRFSRALIGPSAKMVLMAVDVLFVDLFRPDATIEPIREELVLEVLPLGGN